MGENLDDFIYRRRHVFNAFGSQIRLRSTDYMFTVRLLTERLQRQNGIDDLNDFFQFLHSSPYLSCSGLQPICDDPSNFNFDAFLMFLHEHKLLFRLRARDGVVELRHDIVPFILDQDISKVPVYDSLRVIKSAKDLEEYEYIFGDGGAVSVSRWLRENFGDEDDIGKNLKVKTSRLKFLSEFVFRD